MRRGSLEAVSDPRASSRRASAAHAEHEGERKREESDQQQQRSGRRGAREARSICAQSCPPARTVGDLLAHDGRCLRAHRRDIHRHEARVVADEMMSEREIDDLRLDCRGIAMPKFLCRASAPMRSRAHSFAMPGSIARRSGSAAAASTRRRGCGRTA